MTADEADAALFELLASLPTPPRFRSYVLEHIDGEWVFRRREIELAIEEVLGPDAEGDDDRRYGFKLEPTAPSC